MFTVFIADDESKVISGLIHRVNWKKLELSVVGYAENGKEARDKILKLRPDIVITDIYMPGMTGIELINEVSEVTDSVFIIFSAYSEFEYAREAIRMKVVEYLIKPINIREIEHTLSQAGERVLEKRRSSKRKNEEYMLMKLLDGTEGITEDMVPEESAAIIAAVIKAENEEEELGKIREVAESWRLINGRTYTLLRKDRLIVISVQRNYDTDGSLRQWMIDHISRLRVYEDCKFYWGMGCTVERWRDLHRSVYSAEEMLDYSVFYGKQFEGQTETKLGYMEQDRLMEYAKELVFDLGDLVKEREILGKIISHLRENIRNTEAVKARMITFLYHFSKRFEEIHKKKPEESIPDWEIEVVYKIMKAETLENISEIFQTVIVMFHGMIKDEEYGLGHGTVGKVQKYIRRNLKKNISLNDIAEYAERNPAYISHMFKEETGETLFEYITRLRMERAMELLRESQLKIQEIASEVGYEEQSYFSQVFKKYTGITAGNYRKMEVPEKN